MTTDSDGRFPWEMGLVFVPSLLYVAGGVVALVGLFLWPTHLGAALLAFSLVGPELGGLVARRWEVGSTWGEELDWAISAAVAVSTAWCCLGALRGPLTVFALAVWAAVCRYRGWNVSGRAFATVGALVAHFS